MSKSRFIRWHKQRVPKPRHPVSIPGSNTASVEKTSDEAGKWIRCRHCGFPINVDRENISGSDMGDDGVQVQDFDYEEQSRIMRGSSPFPGNRYNRPALVEGDYQAFTLDTLDMPGVMIALDAKGNADSFTYTPRQIVITSGCPLCGSEQN